MKRKYRNNKQINNAIKSAGKTFLGYQTENVLRSIENGSSMNSIIEELYKNQFGFTDAEIIGTSKRVKAFVKRGISSLGKNGLTSEAYANGSRIGLSERRVNGIIGSKISFIDRLIIAIKNI